VTSFRHQHQQQQHLQQHHCRHIAVHFIATIACLCLVATCSISYRCCGGCGGGCALFTSNVLVFACLHVCCCSFISYFVKLNKQDASPLASTWSKPQAFAKIVRKHHHHQQQQQQQS
jgi:hypothetical protein